MYVYIKIHAHTHTHTHTPTKQSPITNEKKFNYHIYFVITKLRKM